MRGSYEKEEDKICNKEDKARWNKRRKDDSEEDKEDNLDHKEADNEKEEICNLVDDNYIVNEVGDEMDDKVEVEREEVAMKKKREEVEKEEAVEKEGEVVMKVEGDVKKELFVYERERSLEDEVDKEGEEIGLTRRLGGLEVAVADGFYLSLVFVSFRRDHNMIACTLDIYF